MKYIFITVETRMTVELLCDVCSFCYLFVLYPIKWYISILQYEMQETFCILPTCMTLQSLSHALMQCIFTWGFSFTNPMHLTQKCMVTSAIYMQLYAAKHNCTLLWWWVLYGNKEKDQLLASLKTLSLCNDISWRTRRQHQPLKLFA